MDKVFNTGNRNAWLNKRKIFCCALLVFLLGCIGHVQAHTILLVYEANNPYQKRLLENLLKRASQPPESGLLLQPISGKEINQTTIDQSKADLILSLGYNNAERLLGLSTKRPVLHALIPQTRLYNLFPCLPRCQNQVTQHSQLLLDQPIERQLALIQLIDPMATRIGVFKGSLGDRYLNRLASLAKLLGFTLDVEDTSPRLLGSHIDQLAQRVDILFAAADPSLYNPSTIPEILLTSYRHHVPVLGFSKGFVRAGSIASVVSSLDQFAQQIDEILKRLQTTHTIPKGVIYPKYFQVVSNRNVARSLNLNFMDDDQLLKQIQQRELAN